MKSRLQPQFYYPPKYVKKSITLFQMGDKNNSSEERNSPKHISYKIFRLCLFPTKIWFILLIKKDNFLSKS